jgi:AraC-like DNA-binding protein
LELDNDNDRSQHLKDASGFSEFPSMSDGPSEGRLLTFATREMPTNDRVPFWLEVFARKIVHINFEPKAGVPVEAAASLLALPNLRLMWCDNATPATWTRPKELLKDGDDGRALLVSIEGAANRTQLDNEVQLEAGDAVGILQCEAARIELRKWSYAAIILPREALSPYVPHFETAARNVVPRECEALGFLRSYLTLVRKDWTGSAPGLQQLASGHVRDLVALCLGANRDGKDAATRLGLRAARFHAIKSAITDNPGVHLSELAQRFGVSSRHIQILFEEEGETFTAYVSGERLRQAHGMLNDPKYRHWTIAAIAFHAGFGDLSHFNRNFKKRYGATPSDLRSQSDKSP